MRKNIILTLCFFGILLLIVGFILYLRDNLQQQKQKQEQHQRQVISPVTYWNIRSIDTMKYSRDPVREKLNDSSFDKTIDKQMTNIAATGANYVAIGTPYDAEFVPMLKRWVGAARKHNLHVWFRGNFSGWEGWFGYPKIDKASHIIQTEQFVVNNPDIFQDGDIFTSCPECENGAELQSGDPESVIAYRSFLILERNTAQRAFSQIGKKVETGYYSMNGDVARAVMDRTTTKALGGIVVVDHYVATPEQLAEDIRDFAQRSGGRVVLGEFGVPIPDINGSMTEDQQALWIDNALKGISGINQLIGVNYWVNNGGSTALWNDDGTPKAAVPVIKRYYK
jgi:hypothetical protein